MCPIPWRRPQWRSSRSRIQSGAVRKKPQRPTTASPAHSTSIENPQHKNAPKPFTFLALPQELKDEIYSHVVGAKADFASTSYHAETTQYQYHCLHRRGMKFAAYVPSAAPSILCANRQIFDETLNTLYRENSFTVVIDPSFPVFAEREYRLKNSRNAVPYGWDLDRIQHLQLRIDMGEESRIGCTEFEYDFCGLRGMGDLKSLRVMVTVWRLPVVMRGKREVTWSGEVRSVLGMLGECLPEGFGNVEFGVERVGERVCEGDSSTRALDGDVVRGLFEEARMEKLGGGKGDGEEKEMGVLA
ncbi:hypothetical protein K458DRAFT_490043 [Lentithecium fluviatile CBS 122367]|uniref:F-box domain-containing protein n=1 Tax=Lentithecium fluviatile CBS 122367 TaxID=1168545 RepID=A0A6G1IQ65_9PLEO|nr:hypothetical protein K458DRAFT_490043 [Lentithecium fluviatile CBS 122367]